MYYSKQMYYKHVLYQQLTRRYYIYDITSTINRVWYKQHQLSIIIHKIAHILVNIYAWCDVNTCIYVVIYVCLHIYYHV